MTHQPKGPVDLTVVVVAVRVGSIGVSTITNSSIGSGISVVELFGSLQVLGGLSGKSHGEHDEESEDGKLQREKIDQ